MGFNKEWVNSVKNKTAASVPAPISFVLVKVFNFMWYFTPCTLEMRLPVKGVYSPFKKNSTKPLKITDFLGKWDLIVQKMFNINILEYLLLA